MHVYLSTVDDISKEFCHFSTEFGIHFILDVSCDLSREVTTIKAAQILGQKGFKTFS